MQFSIYQESRRGARKSNQDRTAYCYSRDALLMLVTDGMGGHPHGEMAAQIAMQFITEAFRRESKPSLADPRLFLRQAISGAHGQIIKYAGGGGLPETPRTTCVACVVQNNAACWAHAGDSRLYHIRDGTIVAQTKDHSLVQQLIDRGRMREEAVAAHPERNRIFNCLGSATPPRVDLSEPTLLQTGDTLMLCSDGLWSPLSANLISSTVLKLGIMQAVPELLDKAEQRAGRECDNLSAIAVTWEEPAPAARADRAPAEDEPPASAAALPQEPGAAERQDAYLSDDEIERAIAQIRSAIKRQTNDKT
jgi:PPM family protein phosphatase